MTLPIFKYHPDPLATGLITTSDAQCICCKQQRGYVYTGPVRPFRNEYVDRICPWCIANGSAHEKLGVEFHDRLGIPGCDFFLSPKVSDDILEEVCCRTPGFNGWQQEQWFTCCEDAAAFLGRAGHTELKERWPEAIPSVQESTGLDGAKWQAFFQTLDRDEGPTAYVFQCLHCGTYGAYQDCH